jgi:hypothetical protein
LSLAGTTVVCGEALVGARCPGGATIMVKTWCRSSSPAVVDHIRVAVDAALGVVLSAEAGDTALRDAGPYLQYAEVVLEHASVGEIDEAATLAVREVWDAARAQHFGDTRVALVTARGRLVRPNTPVLDEVEPSRREFLLAQLSRANRCASRTVLAARGMSTLSGSPIAGWPCPSRVMSLSGLGASRRGPARYVLLPLWSWAVCFVSTATHDRSDEVAAALLGFVGDRPDGEALAMAQEKHERLLLAAR